MGNAERESGFGDKKDEQAVGAVRSEEQIGRTIALGWGEEVIGEPAAPLKREKQSASFVRKPGL